MKVIFASNSSTETIVEASSKNDFITKVNEHLSDQKHQPLADHEYPLIHAALKHGIGAYDTAAQLIANRQDKSGKKVKASDRSEAVEAASKEYTHTGIVHGRGMAKTETVKLKETPSTWVDHHGFKYSKPKNAHEKEGLKDRDGLYLSGEKGSDWPSRHLNLESIKKIVKASDRSEAVEAGIGSAIGGGIARLKDARDSVRDKIKKHVNSLKDNISHKTHELLSNQHAAAADKHNKQSIKHIEAYHNAKGKNLKQHHLAQATYHNGLANHHGNLAHHHFEQAGSKATIVTQHPLPRNKPAEMTPKQKSAKTDRQTRTPKDAHFKKPVKAPTPNAAPGKPSAVAKKPSTKGKIAPVPKGWQEIKSAPKPAKPKTNRKSIRV